MQDSSDESLLSKIENMQEVLEKNLSYKILIIEDGLLNQQVLKEILKDTYQILCIETGSKAIGMVGRYHPDLILLDIILPDINGFEVLRQLKEKRQSRDIPVIIITGLNNDTDEEKGLTLGAVDYIRKPFNALLVKARVNIHIQIIKQLKAIERLSFFDPLTGLPNRRKFDYHLEYEWIRALRKKTKIGLLMMDLDYFKKYNDAYGHTQGDIMLKAVSKVLADAPKCRSGVPCRMGGEEFSLLVPETTPEEILLISERIRTQIEEIRVTCADAEVVTKITMSIGAIAIVPENKEQLSLFVRKADGLLYKAKENGRNRVEVGAHALVKGVKEG